MSSARIANGATAPEKSEAEHQRQRMRTSATEAGHCRAILELLKDKRPHRSGELLAACGGIAPSMLKRRLESLRLTGQRIEMVTDKRVPDVGRVVEYQMLT